MRQNTGSHAGMFANNAGAELETPARFDVHHARQVVDQVTLLRERVKRQEQAIAMVVAERDKAIDCCEKQKEVIQNLQQRLHTLAACEPATAGARYGHDVIDDADHNATQNASNQLHGDATSRVNSMRGALLRIGGVEGAAAETANHNNTFEAFDASEFQPIVDEQGASRVTAPWVTVKRAVKNAWSKAAAVVGIKREITNIESSGLQT